MGLFMGPLMIPTMPEMIAATKLAFPNCDLDYANSLLSGFLNTCFGIGTTVGPLLGSILYQATDFRVMNNIFGAYCILQALVYFLCAQGYQAYAQTFNNFGSKQKLMAHSDEKLTARDLRGDFFSSTDEESSNDVFNE